MNLKILQSNILVKFYKFLITLISFVPHIFSNVKSKSYPTQSLKASSQLCSNNYMFHLSRRGGTRGPGGLRPLPFLHSGRIIIKTSTIKWPCIYYCIPQPQPIFRPSAVLFLYYTFWKCSYYGHINFRTHCVYLKLF